MQLPRRDLLAGGFLAFSASSDPMGRFRASANAVHLADPGGGAGAALADFTQMATGAVARSLQEKAREQISDADFSTLDQALTAAAGRQLLITEAHVVTAAAIIPANTEIVGLGGSITASGTGFNAVESGGDNVRISGLRVIGPGSHAAPANTDVGNGIHALRHDNVTVESCMVSGFNNTGILIRDGLNCVVTTNILFGNTYPTSGGNDSADIALYSSTQGARTGITNNLCLSNNSQGVYVNALGHDDDMTITGNVCVATDGGSVETGLANLKRRHGIVLGYNQAASGGRVNCANNVVRNTLSTGIYAASNTNGARAVSVIGNTISKVGQDTAVQGSLTGGITVVGGGAGTILAFNTIYDFRGTGSSGAINISTGNSDAMCQVTGNTIDTSTSNGIILQDASAGCVVRGNITRNVAGVDIYESTASAGGHTITDNDCLRSRVGHSIYVAFGSGTAETLVEGNKLVGFGKRNGTPDTHAGVFMENNTSRRVIVRRNRITGFRAAVRPGNVISTRLYDSILIDDNLLRNNHFAITCYDFTQTGVVPVCGNVFEGNDSDLSGAGGSNVAYIAERRNGKILLLDQAAAPANGTWIAGDRAEYSAPRAGAPPGAVCTTGGSPGRWTSMAALSA